MLCLIIQWFFIHPYTTTEILSLQLLSTLSNTFTFFCIFYLFTFSIFLPHTSFSCWQLTIKLYCYQRFGLSLVFLVSPTYFSHSVLLPWRWRQQNSQECLSSMGSYLSKRIRHKESHSETEIDISMKFKLQEHVCLQTSVKFNSLSRIKHQLCAVIIPHQRLNQSCKFPVFESYTLQARQNIGIVSQTERVNVH
jgi:hypothetical protein